MLPLAAAALLILSATPIAGAEGRTEHPLVPVLRMAQDRLEFMDRGVRDYTCVLVKRERVRGRLMGRQHMYVKLRHEQVRNGRAEVPFSVYVRFLEPADVRGREVLYVRGRNGGKAIARNGGTRFAHVTTAVDPAGDLAMEDHRHPITEIGIRRLIERLIQVATRELPYDECDVKYYTGAKVNDRPCTVIEVVHPVRREYFQYYFVRIFVDDELQLPIRFVAYEFPEKEGGEARLIEEYTYLDLKLNVGLTDWDFNHRNDNYHFRDDFEP